MKIYLKIRIKTIDREDKKFYNLDKIIKDAFENGKRTNQKSSARIFRRA